MMKFSIIHTRSSLSLSRSSLRRGLLFSGSAGLILTPAVSQAQPARNSPLAAPRLAPNAAAARVALERARQLDRQGVSSLAAVQFRAAAELAPRSVEMARALAGFYSRQERWEEASEAWRRVLSLRGKVGDSEAATQLARAQGALLRNSDALPSRMAAPRTAAPLIDDNAPNGGVPDAVFQPAPRSFAVTPNASNLNGSNSSGVTSTRGSAQTLPPQSQSSSGSAVLQTPIAPLPEPVLPAPTLVEPVPAAPLTAPVLPAPSQGVTAAPPVDLTQDVPPQALTPQVAPPQIVPPRVTPRRVVPAPERRAIAPVRALGNVTPIAFQSPKPQTPRVSARNRANAWPLVNAASKALGAGRTSSALSLYQQAALVDPTNAYALPGVGTSYIVLGRFAEAANTYRRFLAIKPNDAKALRGLADALTYSQKSREALGVNNAILARSPGDFAASYQNAQLATYLGAYAQSDRFFGIALSAKPGSADAWAAWGESLAYRRDSRAVSRFNRALSLQPNSPRALTGLGDYYSYIGQFDQAIPRYRAALVARQGVVKTQVALGDALTYSGQTLAAVPVYRAALAKAPTNRAARLGLGRALVYSGNSEGGAAELRRVLAVEPNNAPALEALALAQADFAPTAAIASYQKVLARQTTAAGRAKTLASIGDLRARSNQFSLALESYSQAAALAPSDPKIGLSYAQLLASQEQFAAARPVLEAVLVRQPGNAQALALQVQIENQTGNTARAQELSARLETITPATADEALSLAEALRATGNSAAANRILTRAASSVSDPQTALRVADATRDAGDYVTSASLYNRILTSNPRNIDARLSLAEALIYQKDLTGAQAQVQRVLALDPANVQAKVLTATIALRADTDAGRASASQQANAILANDPNNPGALIIAGQVATSRQQFADAISQFRSAVLAQPANLEARLGLARNLYYSRDIEGSIAEYRELIRRLPTDTLPRLELAQIYLDRNRFSDAEALYNEVLALRRGLPLSATARWQVQTRASARLSPMAQLNSPLRPKTPLRIRSSRRVIVDAPTVKAPTVNAQVRRVSAPNPRFLLAQNVAPGTGTIASAAASGAGTLPASPGINGGALPGAASAGGTASAPSPLTPSVPDLGAPVAPPVPTPVAPLLPGTSTAGAIAATPLSDQTAALRGLGEIRRRQERFGESLDFFNQAATLDPADSAAQVGVAQALRGQSKYADALAQTDRVLATDGANLPARVLRAQLLGDSGQAAQAQQELDSLVASLPETAPLETYTTLTQAFNTLQNYPASLQLLDEAARLFPREPSVPRLRAETLTFAKRNDEAIAIYDQLIAADPQDADAVLGKARVYNYSDQLPLAETTYRQALQVQPTNYQATTELADVLGRRANFAESISLYQAAIGANPTDLATRIELARVQRFAGQPADAEVTLNQVLEADPRSVPGLTERGVLRGTQGSYAPAIADLSAALEVSPTDLNAQLGLAEVQSYAGNYAESITGLRAILVRDPQNVRARTQLGTSLSYTGQTADALKELNAVLVANPTSLDARIAKADVLGRAGRTAESVTLFNQILAAEPGNVRARTGLADAYVAGRQFDNAVSVYDSLIALDSTNPTYKIQRARALGYGGRSKEAVTSLRSVVAADPSNQAARLALAEVGTNSGSNALLGDAIAEYRQILQADPSNVPAQIGLGRALSYKGKYGEATRTLNTVLAANPGNTDATYALAETQRFSGNTFDAAKTYGGLLKTSPGDAPAAAGLRAVKRVNAPLATVGGSYYSDTNGVRLRSLNYGATLPTRAGTIGVIAERGKFSQNGSERNRNALSLLLGKAFGPVTARLVLTRLKYDGAPNKTLFDLLLSTVRGPRQNYYFGVAKRDIFESDAAVAAGITATLYRAGFVYPLGSKLDLEAQLTRYRYSDSNSRTSFGPSIFYRFRPTNPSLRVGLGYFYDNTKEQRNGPPFLYYTPQSFNATSVLADYVVNQGDTRYSLAGAYPLTGRTGDGGINRPAKTLFGSISRDLSDALELFADGGIVRAPAFRSNQVSGGVNLRF